GGDGGGQAEEGHRDKSLRCLPTGRLAVEVIKTNPSRCKRRPPSAATENAGSAGGAGVQPKAMTTAIMPPAPSAAARWRAQWHPVLASREASGVW
ncbi:unnamed protein product, partial [Ectocarpus sp. 6 AP-2014]